MDRNAIYGSHVYLTIEANKENIPPGMELLKQEPLVLPEPRTAPRTDEDPQHSSPFPPRPSPAMSQLSDASFMSCQDSPVVNTSADETDDESETTSRKEKSLGLLCQRFLIAMNEETRDSQTNEVHLESVARKMNVEKRRIYDIVNVMEALDAMSKTNKSFYRWEGLEKLPQLMQRLQYEAIEEGLPDRVLRVEHAMCSFTELSSPSSRKKEVVGSLVNSDPSTSKEQPEQEARRSRVDTRDKQGRNSLAQLCRRFLMVLLSNPRNIRKVSLDVASTVLIKDPDTEGFEPPSRSRCRRLYDIANVLVALGLIKKVHYLFGTKKIPLFVYCGPEPDINGKFDVYASVEKLLSSQQNAPQTPTIKATTDKIVQQIAGFGKRVASETNLENVNRTMNKMAKTTTPVRMVPPPAPAQSIIQQSMVNNSSLMMFAELAAVERLRLDQFARQFNQIAPLMPSTSSNNLPRSLPCTTEVPKLKIPKPEPIFGEPYQPNCAVLPIRRSPVKQELPIRHSMSNILGNSNKTNIQQTSFDHTTNSPFQVVIKSEKREKKVFGEIQNFH